MQVVDLMRGGTHHAVAMIIQCRRAGVDQRRLDQRLVTLHIDDDVVAIEAQLLTDFGQAVAAGRVIVASQHRPNAMLGTCIDNFSRVGCDDHCTGRRHRRTSRYMDHHRQPGDIGQRFARQPGRTQPGRDQNGESHAVASGRRRSGCWRIGMWWFKRARLGFEHHRDAIADRKRQPIGVADQFLLRLLWWPQVLQRAFADRADHQFKQSDVHGARRIFTQAKPGGAAGAAWRLPLAGRVASLAAPPRPCSRAIGEGRA